MSAILENMESWIAKTVFASATFHTVTEETNVNNGDVDIDSDVNNENEDQQELVSVHPRNQVQATGVAKKKKNAVPKLDRKSQLAQIISNPQILNNDTNINSNNDNDSNLNPKIGHMIISDGTHAIPLYVPLPCNTTLQQWLQGQDYSNSKLNASASAKNSCIPIAKGSLVRLSSCYWTVSHVSLIRQYYHYPMQNDNSMNMNANGNANANANGSGSASGSRSNVLNGEMGMYQINADVERYPFCLILYQDPLPYNPKYTLLDDDLVANMNVNVNANANERANLNTDTDGSSTKTSISPRTGRNNGTRTGTKSNKRGMESLGCEGMGILGPPLNVHSNIDVRRALKAIPSTRFRIKCIQNSFNHSLRCNDDDDDRSGGHTDDNDNYGHHDGNVDDVNDDGDGDDDDDDGNVNDKEHIGSTNAVDNVDNSVPRGPIPTRYVPSLDPRSGCIGCIQQEYPSKRTMTYLLKLCDEFEKRQEELKSKEIADKYGLEEMFSPESNPNIDFDYGFGNGGFQSRESTQQEEDESETETGGPETVRRSVISGIPSDTQTPGSALSPIRNHPIRTITAMLGNDDDDSTDNEEDNEQYDTAEEDQDADTQENNLDFDTQEKPILQELADQTKASIIDNNGIQANEDNTIDTLDTRPQSQSQSQSQQQELPLPLSESTNEHPSTQAFVPTPSVIEREDRNTPEALGTQPLSQPKKHPPPSSSQSSCSSGDKIGRPESKRSPSKYINGKKVTENSVIDAIDQIFTGSDTMDFFEGAEVCSPTSVEDIVMFLEQYFDVTLKEDWINLIQNLYETKTNNDIDDGVSNESDDVDNNVEGREEDDAIATTEHSHKTAKETHQSEDHSQTLVKHSGILENRAPLALDKNADIDKGVVEENQSSSKLALLSVSSIDTDLELDTQPNTIHRDKKDRIEASKSRQSLSTTERQSAVREQETTQRPKDRPIATATFDAKKASLKQKKEVLASGSNQAIGENKKVINKSRSDKVNGPRTQKHGHSPRNPATVSTALDNLRRQSVGQLRDQTTDKSNKPVRNKKRKAPLKSSMRPSFSLSSFVTIDDKKRKRGRGDKNRPTKKKKRPTTAFDISSWLRK